MRLSLLWFYLAAGAWAQNAPADARDLLARALQLISTNPAGAAKLLEQARQIDPALPTLRYQLGLAYHAIGDEADAAAEFREAILQAPDSASAHNYLGITLFQSGDARAALEEFRAAARLSPKDPNAHFNLGEALARTGDSTGAVEELRVATGLAPSDAGLVRLLQTVESKLAAPEGTIQVEVRQVLVPVVVADPQGHHVTGLTQADFKVYEDGVEQKITSFSVERSGSPDTATPPGNEAPAAVPRQAPAHPVKPRRTYMVLLDTMHTSFEHLVSAREALVKLFRQERSEDSQYVVIALGVSPEILVNVTPNAAAVLAALENKRLQKLFLDGQMGGSQPDMARFRRGLTETRAACDLAASDSAAKIKCAAGLTTVTEQARQIGDLERTLTTEFLRQLRSLVAQLARARDRRTILLVSDGLSIDPGRKAFALVSAFFPPASHCFVPQDVFCPPAGVQTTSPMAEEFESILKLAAASNVVIDTIDSRGLYGQQAFDASNAGASAHVEGAVGRVERDAASAKGNTLAEISGSTGGTNFHDSNDLFGGLSRAFADGRDFYTIGYVSGNANYDGKFRAITVEVRDSHAVVNAKRGYWAVPGAQ